MHEAQIGEWHALDVAAVFEKYHTSKNGLDSAEAKKRLKEFGPNTIQTKTSETLPKIFLRQLHNPIVYVLILSTLMALILGKWIDASVVFCVVILNTLIGFFQEQRAHKVIRELTSMVPLKTTVIRDADKEIVLSSQIVPGDIVYLEAGDKISADMRIFFAKNLQCDESTITGESLPVHKKTERVSLDAPLPERKCMAYNGTYVTSGVGMGIVVSTGLKTEFGKISELIEQVSPLKTPLSITLNKIAFWITCGVIFIGVLLFIIGYLKGFKAYDSGLSAVALAVAAIPEGLPAIITIASAIGVRRMAQRKAIVRQLPAVEALGSTTVICTDKTGTLTYNEMTVQRVWTHSGFFFLTGGGFSLEGEIILPKGQKVKTSREEIEEVLKAAVICSDAMFDESKKVLTPIGDPTEIALVVALRKAGFKEDALRHAWKRKDSIPFEPAKKWMATLNISEGKEKYIFVKGAPEEVVKMCTVHDPEHVLRHADEMAKEGMRLLAVAKKETYIERIEEKDVKEGFFFLGLIGMVDPPRKEIQKSLKRCFEAGITVKMVTGDHPFTAEVIGKELGIFSKGRVLTGPELSKLDEKGWKIVAKEHHVFARVSPEHKLKLVGALQGLNQVVAMTGDGVNDAPALKKADIGIAMGIKGTAVAKEASDMILADDNFTSIEAAVEEGRRFYDNLVKSLAFVFPTSLGQALIILIPILFFPIKHGIPMHPILPVQILWVNLVVAVALALPLALEAAEPDIMLRPPKKKKSPIFSRFIVVRTFTVAFLIAVGTIGVFLWKYQMETQRGMLEKFAIAEAQTLAVTTIMLFQAFYLFNCRSLRFSIFRIGFFSNPSVIVGVVFVWLTQLGFVYLPFMNKLFHSRPLTVESWVVAVGVALAVIPVVLIEKLLSRKLRVWRHAKKKEG